MKKLFLSGLLFAAFALVSSAQIAHDLEIFSETGDKFKVYVNGLLLSEKYGSHVKLDNIQNDFLNIKMEFEDQTKGTIEKKYLGLSDPSEGTSNAPKSPCANVYKVKANKKGELVLTFVSRSKKKIQTQTVVNQTVINETQPQQTGSSISIDTPVGGIKLTIFN